MGAFLRSRRERMARAAHDLPPLPRGRVNGLRREEVSFLCGVSVTWYTWLEQGRAITPSRQVLDAVARTLRLSVAEHEYLLGLGGYAAPNPSEVQVIPSAPPHIQRLLDEIGDRPAYALAADWSIAAWNAAYAALYPNVATTDPSERNLLWLVFTDPAVRDLLDDWEVTSQRFLAEFRAETASRLTDSHIQDLVTRLRETSVQFRRGWDGHPIAGFVSRERTFHHPTVGTLHLEHHQVRASDHPNLQLVIYTPLDDTTRTRLAQV
ncbi:XRE family transcriptional regulator [Mycolicibacterium sp. P1-18]|nr:XRE family transcriptional regulator [Mycolicibacterium sp. P1-18]